MAETPVKEPPVEEEAPAAETPVKEPPAEEEAPPAEVKTEEKPEPSVEKKKKRDKKALLLLLLLLIGIGVGVYFAFFREDPDDNRIPYAQGVVLLEGDEVEPVEEGWMNLRYNRKAFSNDGIHFSGLLSNDAGNVYDMYFDVYADAQYEDRVFLSGLVAPGYGLRTFELSHELPVGSTVCYVVFNQVDTDEDGNQSLVRQMVVTVEFVVNG